MFSIPFDSSSGFLLASSHGYPQYRFLVSRIQGQYTFSNFRSIGGGNIAVISAAMFFEYSIKAPMFFLSKKIELDS